MANALIFAVILLVLAFREFEITIVLPARARALHTMGRRDAAIRGFEKAIAVWSLRGDAVKDDSRFRLSYLYMEQGRHEEAASLLRHALTHRKAPGV